MTNSQQTRPTTPEEDIKELYSRTAKLNDIASALLAPAWGSETGIIPADHPLYVAEEPPAAQQEQAAPDWQAIARKRERELKTVGEQKHAVEQELATAREALASASLRAARMEHAAKQAAELRVRLEDAEAGITAAIRQRKLAEDVAARAKELLARRTETLRKRAERAEAALARVRDLARPYGAQRRWPTNPGRDRQPGRPPRLVRETGAR